MDFFVVILDFQDTIATLNIICRLHLSLFELCQEFIHRSDLIWKICRTHTDFFRHMTVTGTKCKISILPCICRCFHTCCKRCTSIEHFHTIQAVLPRMLHEHEGCIVNISSIWGLRGASCEVTYAATKAALIGLTRSLAAELAPSGIRVNCVAPGVIRTDMLNALPPAVLPQLAEETPLGRLGTPEDIAEAVAFLADQRASFITGQVLTVDGGFIL